MRPGYWQNTESNDVRSPFDSDHIGVAASNVSSGPMLSRKSHFRPPAGSLRNRDGIEAVTSATSPPGAGRSQRYLPTHSRNEHYSRARRPRWRPDETERHRLQVLNSGGEVELVTGSGQAAQPHALEAMVRLQVLEAHLDPLALVA